MEKKLMISLILVLIFMLTVPSTVAAQEQNLKEAQTKDRLGKVTMLVKRTIDIGDHYTQFNGNLQEDILKSYWNLYWNSDNDSLNILTDEEGKIYQYNRQIYNQESSPYSPYYEPTFPPHSQKEALKISQDFIAKVLAENEEAEFQPVSPIESLSPRSYSFRGTIYLNGVKSDLSFQITVNAQNLILQSFSRSDAHLKILPEIPDNITKISSEKASSLLSEKLKLKLEYVLVPVEKEKEESMESKLLPPILPQPENSTVYKAVLRYLPVTEGNWIVDAKSGEVIDISLLYQRNMGKDFATLNAAPMVENANRDYQEYLTPVELEGVDKLDGALSKEVLENIIKALAPLKIDKDFILNSFNFRLNEKTEEITAYLNFSKSYNEEMTQFIHKYLVLDGKTGRLISLSTSYPFLDEEVYKTNIEKKEAQNVAESFLKSQESEKFNDSKLFQFNDPGADHHQIPVYSFTYAQNKNNFFLPANALYVSINGENGAVDNYNANWIDNILFDSAEDLISQKDALSILTDAHETQLSYMQLPAKIDPDSPLFRPLMNYGYINEFKLAYNLVSSRYIYGIDAKTGELLQSEAETEPQALVYQDIEGHYAAEKIQKLADYGIGFKGQNFYPDQELTQKEMLLFLLSARMPGSDLEKEEELLYNQAIQLGLIKKDEKDPQSSVSKTQVVKALLRMAGYTRTAQLEGIFRVDFVDQESIEYADYGYVAIAKGLKLIQGDLKGNFNPNQTATRAILATIYYNYLNR